MVQLTDIERVAPGVENLSTAEHEALQRFTLLWTLFEAQMLGSNASVRKISEKVEGIEPEIINDGWFTEHLDYFSNRYIDGGIRIIASKISTCVTMTTLIWFVLC